MGSFIVPMVAGTAIGSSMGKGGGGRAAPQQGLGNMSRLLREKQPEMGFPSLPAAPPAPSGGQPPMPGAAQAQPVPEPPQQGQAQGQGQRRLQYVPPSRRRGDEDLLSQQALQRIAAQFMRGR